MFSVQSNKTTAFKAGLELFANSLLDFNESDFRLRMDDFPWQREIFEDTHRFKIIPIGRRGGKTDYATSKLGILAHEKGMPYAYFSLSYENMRKIFDEAVLRFKDVIKKVGYSTHEIEFYSGGTVTFYSLNDQKTANKRRGAKFAGIIIDECGFIPDLEYVFEKVLFPTLNDYQGWIDFMGTPNGRNYYWQLFLRGESTDVQWKNWKSWRMASWEANTKIPMEEFELARSIMPSDKFQEEYEAVFLEGHGAVFRNIIACVKHETFTYKEDGRYVGGVDWGQSNDFTVAVIMEANTKQVVAIERFNKISWQLQQERIIKLATDWHISKLAVELNSIGSVNYEALASTGKVRGLQGFTTTNESKNRIIESLSIDLEQGNIGLLNHPETINELQAFEYKIGSSGKRIYAAPSGMHDDCVMGLALADYACSLTELPFYVMRR